MEGEKVDMKKDGGAKGERGEGWKGVVDGSESGRAEPAGVHTGDHTELNISIEERQRPPVG